MDTRDLVLDVNLFADGACAVPSLIMKISGIYATGGPTGPGYEIRISPKSVLLTLINPDVVSYYNAKKACGYSDWALNTEKDISGIECEPSVVPLIPEQVDDIYNVTNGVLRFGSFPLPSPTTPISLSAKMSFTRIQ